MLTEAYLLRGQAYEELGEHKKAQSDYETAKTQADYEEYAKEYEKANGE